MNSLNYNDFTAREKRPSYTHTEPLAYCKEMLNHLLFHKQIIILNLQML